MKNLFRFAALAGASLVLGLSAQAGTSLGGVDTPGSLLVFPTFDNIRGDHTLLTVTNTADGSVTTFGSTLGGTVKVEFVYINRLNCQEFNRTRTLTPLDTLSVLTKLDNPSQVAGYCYVFAKHPTSGAAVAFDYLIGTERVFSAVDNDYEVQPWVFEAVPADGSETDILHTVDGVSIPVNGHRDLDDGEYTRCPNWLLIPRFIGQFVPENYLSDLVFIGLTGGSEFTTLVEFLIYNDNEEEFSAQYSFKCYERVPLSTISGAFDHSFLFSTNQSANETQLPPGPHLHETGWLKFNGLAASSTATTLSQPAILGALIERSSLGAGMVMPWAGEITGSTQKNGRLLAHSVSGN